MSAGKEPAVRLAGSIATSQVAPLKGLVQRSVVGSIPAGSAPVPVANARAMTAAIDMPTVTVVTRGGIRMRGEARPGGTGASPPAGGRTIPTFPCAAMLGSNRRVGFLAVNRVVAGLQRAFNHAQRYEERHDLQYHEGTDGVQHDDEARRLGLQQKLLEIAEEPP